MSNFEALGQLVTEARNLLDSIKGGAIRVMQSSFDALMISVNDEWAAKKTQVDNEALAAIGRVDTATVIASMGFEALNYNSDFKDVVAIDAGDATTNTWPLGLGWSSSFNFNSLFHAEVISVSSADDPVTRPIVVKELLDVMGLGRDATTIAEESFGILKLTVKALPTDPNKTAHLHVGSDFHMPKNGGVTLMHYLKGPTTGNAWQRVVDHRPLRSGVLDFVHYDIQPLGGGAQVGDVIYIALPMACTGLFPQSVPHSKLPNMRNKQVRDDNAVKILAGI